MHLHISLPQMETKRKRIAVLGSTGSIGTQTLDIIRRNPELYEVSTLIAGRRVKELIEQAREFHPKRAIIAEAALYPLLKAELEPLGIETVRGVGYRMEAGL